MLVSKSKTADVGNNVAAHDTGLIYSIFNGATQTSGPRKEPETKTSGTTSTGKKGSGVSGEDDLMKSFNAVLVEGMKFGKDSLDKLETKLDALVDQATDMSTIEKDKSSLKDRLSLMRMAQYSNSLLAASGNQAAVQASSVLGEQINNLEYVLSEMEINPKRSLANKKLNLYKDLAGYIQSMGQAIGYARPDTGNALIGIANIYASKANIAAQKIAASANIASANLQVGNNADGTPRIDTTAGIDGAAPNFGGLAVVGDMWSKLITSIGKNPTKEQKEALDGIANIFTSMTGAGINKLLDSY